ncbi:MAG: hypothetical protein LBJ31_09005 [Treponema sp.]|jgi:hypothetical protein|nr:hypothetical protein [Treponema sp.]
MDDKTVKLVYQKKYRRDFTAIYTEIIYDDKNKTFELIYFYDSESGTLELKNGIKKIHRWEDEDEAQSGSYLNRRFTTVLLDGAANDSATEDRIINANLSYIKTLHVGERETALIGSAVKKIKAAR